jgi:poly-gamma-glutamate synthesis protein (capsule biosynthesis protein)
MRLIACGDIALCRGVENTLIEKGLEGVVSAEVLPTLGCGDLFLGNVECPVTDHPKPNWEYFQTLKASMAVGPALQSLGLDAVSIANNHIADYGKDGLRETISLLDNLGIAWSGAGWSQEKALHPLIIERNGLSLGILSLAQPEISASTRLGWGAGVLEEKSAIAAMEKLAGRVDIAIAYLHFGIEFAEFPAPSQIRLSRALIDAGAKLVLGHHPHVPQGWEWYKDGFIAYSLGNFIFDMQPGPHPFSRLGLVVQAEFAGRALKEVTIIPVETTGGFTRLLAAAEEEKARGHLQQLCDAIQDRELLYARYYQSCRENLNTHLNALIEYGVKRRKWRRVASLLRSQFWPQIFELRRDLFKFLISGYAWEIERRKTQSTGRLASVWRQLCHGAALAGTRWGRSLNPAKQGNFN